MFNINDLVGKTKILFKFPIKCYVSLYGGLIISYLFCKNFVDDMFGMFIMESRLFRTLNFVSTSIMAHW